MWLQKLVSSINDRTMRDIRRRPEHYRDLFRKKRKTNDLVFLVNGPLVVLLVVVGAAGGLLKAEGIAECVAAVFFGSLAIVGTIAFLKWLRTASRRQIDRCEREIESVRRTGQVSDSPPGPTASGRNGYGESDA